ncbi:DUF6701 domain-containing protein [Psychromonas aquimarina]|uniref:DUF6701 domain-containing protein n=1 Tax=Psychromonas aquimarina TaxID=444919 RepID=UPI0004229DE8|nr:DUF6701 domain-containing protein [Psychromonas aquimarina]
MKPVCSFFFWFLIVFMPKVWAACEPPADLADYTVINGNHVLIFANDSSSPGIYVDGNVTLVGSIFTGNIYATGNISLQLFSLVNGAVYAEGSVSKILFSSVTGEECDGVPPPAASYCDNPPDVSGYIFHGGDLTVGSGTTLTGDHYVTGNLTLAGTTGNSTTELNGNVYVQGNALLNKKSYVSGDAYVVGTLNTDNQGNTIINGDLCEGGDPIDPPDIPECDKSLWEHVNTQQCNGDFVVHGSSSASCNGAAYTDWSVPLKVSGSVLIEAAGINNLNILAVGAVLVKSGGKSTGRLYSDTSVTVEDGAEVAAGLICVSPDPGDDYIFEIITLPDALTCEPHSVTIQVKNSDGSTAVDYTGLITLSTSPALGSWSKINASGTLTDSGNVDGQAAYQFVSTDNGVIELGLFNNVASGLTVLAAGGAVSSNPASISFRVYQLKSVLSCVSNDAANCFTVANRPFSMSLSAVGKDQTTDACKVIEEYTGVQQLKFWSSYLNPVSAAGLNVEVNQTAIENNAADASEQSITFLNGVATVSVNYPDAGQIQIHARDDQGIGAPPADPGQGDELQGSAIAVVNPLKLTISKATKHFRNLAAGRGISEQGWIRASVPDYSNNPLEVDTFDVTVKAIIDCTSSGVAANCGDTTGDDIYIEAPSFVNSINLESSLISPAGGRLGNIAYDNNNPKEDALPLEVEMSGGKFIYSDLAYDEVGTLGLQATSSNYLAITGNNIAASDIKVTKRFFPDYLAYGAYSLTPACNNDFTYLGQQEAVFNYTMQAYFQGASPGVTENYDHSIGYPVAEKANFSHYAYDQTSPAAVDLTSRLLAGDYYQESGWDEGKYTISELMGINKDSSPDGPYFSSDNAVNYFIKLNGNDGEKVQTDSATSCDDDKCVIGSLGDLAYGRLQAGNGYGSEFQPVRTNVEAAYYNGTVFVPMTRDVCTTVSMAQVSTNPVKNGADEITVGTGKTKLEILNSPLIGGKSYFDFSAPKDRGKLDYFIDIHTVAPWLLDGDNAVACPGAAGTEKECIFGEVSFGLFRGNDRIIYRLQTFE